jgi:outer membrane protein OmpA-like peptidoglycan-associated protein
MLRVNLADVMTARTRCKVVPRSAVLIWGSFIAGRETNLLVEEGMQRNLDLRSSWVSLAAFLLAAVILSPAARLQAQANTTEFGQNVKEVYFPLNVYSKVVDPQVLDRDAAWLKQHSDAHFWIEGYADVRGDIFYNLVLSYRRAQFVKTSLMNRGVNESQIGFATGWGQLYPVCAQTDSDCYQKNRRVDMVLPELLSLM